MGDLNSDLVHFYRVVRDHPAEVYDGAGSWERTRKTYYVLRDHKGPESDVSRAGRFFFLNRLCFNGIYRTNKLGHFNVPFGSGRVGAFPTMSDFLQASDALRKVELLNGDFALTLRNARRGDFCYIDPPYYSDSSRVFAEYDHRPFGRADLARLRQELEALDEAGVYFMVSYQEGDEAARLAAGFTQEAVPARRIVASATTSRKTVMEAVIRNYS